MKTGWEIKRIDEIATIKPSKGEARERATANTLVSFLPMEDLGVAIKYPQPRQIRKLSDVVGSYTYFAEGDVLLAKITPCFENGKLGIATGLRNGIGFGSSEFIVLRPNKTVSKEWLFHFLSREDFRIQGRQRMGGAVGQQRVPKEYVEASDIPIPPLAEQQRIVGVLDEAFVSLATAQAHAEKNLQNARALFESHLQSVFTQRGNGWVEKRKPLTELCELIVDCEHKTAPIQKEGIPSIRTPNIGKGKLLLDGVNRVSEETYKAWTRRAEPLPGDLILAREAPAGNVAVIPESTRVCLGQRTVLIRPKADVFEPSFLAFLLLESGTQAKLLAHSRGATVQHVNMKDIRALDVGATPPLEVQKSIVSVLRNLDNEIQRLETLYQQKQAALAALKKSLLHEAFSGAL